MFCCAVSVHVRIEHVTAPYIAAVDLASQPMNVVAMLPLGTVPACIMINAHIRRVACSSSTDVKS